jgi:[acyl-carrier-protein] S-malonyltransferase
MKSAVFMFPGQSSRYPEMIEKLTLASPQAAVVVRRASEVLGRDVAQHYRAANTAMFARNRDVQIGVFLANHLHLVLLERAGVRADWSLGSSLGEYNHLVHIGALAFEDALLLVEQRGRLYEIAEGGAMVALFPIDASVVLSAIEELGLVGRASIGLYNSPRQQVLSGDRSAVAEVVARLVEAEELLHTTEIEPQIPMHAAVFEPTGTKLGAILRDARIAMPRRPYVPNVVGEVLESPSAEEIRACLTRHVHEAVRWQASVEAVAARVPSACFIEVGPRSILHDLFGRGWTPGRRAKTDAPKEWPEHFAALTAELAQHAA